MSIPGASLLKDHLKVAAGFSLTFRRFVDSFLMIELPCLLEVNRKKNILERPAAKVFSHGCEGEMAEKKREGKRANTQSNCSFNVLII